MSHGLARRVFLGLPLLCACRRLEPRSSGPQAKAPPFDLMAHDGKRYSLTQLTQRGPAVVIFYRGFW